MSNAAEKSPRLTPFQASHHLARRLDELGFEPYQSKNGRYLVLMEETPGEVFDLGRPLKGSRFFSKNALRKDRKIIADFEEWAAEDGLDRCYFWSIGVPTRKPSSNELEEAMQTFNAAINQEFSFLRTTYEFEPLLLTIHVRYDQFSDLVDLHAHFVCRVPHDNHLDAIKHHLRRKFSKTDFPLKRIRSAGACATYMHARIFDNAEMLNWPDAVLSAAWKATANRFQFSRPTGAFAKWRAVKAAANDNPEAKAERKRRRENRRATADKRERITSKDRFLGKIKATVRGMKTLALLFEQVSDDQSPSNDNGSETPPNYSSATGGVTQNATRERVGIMNRCKRLMSSLCATSRERISLSTPGQETVTIRGQPGRPDTHRSGFSWIMKAFTILHEIAVSFRIRRRSD